MPLINNQRNELPEQPLKVAAAYLYLLKQPNKLTKLIIWQNREPSELQLKTYGLKIWYTGEPIFLFTQDENSNQTLMKQTGLEYCFYFFLFFFPPVIQRSLPKII